MSNNNQPPFYVWQKVVALTTDNITRFRKKGVVYTVLGLDKCSSCGKWAIDIGERVHAIYEKCRCGDIALVNKNVWHHYADRFAPLNEQHTDITAELANKAITEETPDVVRINKPANNVGDYWQGYLCYGLGCCFCYFLKTLL